MSTSSRLAVIATEQRAVDRAYACYEAKLTELSGDASARAAASGKDGITARVESLARAEAFRLEDENLVTMRVDTRSDETGEPEGFYIGRRTVHDAETATPSSSPGQTSSPLRGAWPRRTPRERSGCGGGWTVTSGGSGTIATR
ncbi:hypothetical protein AB0442_03235 [Kitasatospora sp. NPDC085895]|uniref:hypothetical protein n=1 Tax=Kitasatospora sp. NPDC085895 TaxID=3155057 RepID=UPI0034509F5F